MFFVKELRTTYESFEQTEIVSEKSVTIDQIVVQHLSDR